MVPLEGRSAHTRVADFGVFVQSEALIDERLMLTAGMRADRSSNNGNTSKFYTFPKFSGSYRIPEVKPGLLGDREPVHVAAQQDRRPRPCTSQHRGHGGGSDPGADLKPKTVELGEHSLLGFRQLQPDFWALVQHATYPHQFGRKRLRLLAQGVGASGFGHRISFAVWSAGSSDCDSCPRESSRGSHAVA